MRFFITRFLPLAALAIIMTGCTTNEATGRLQFNQMTREQEEALGEEAMPQLIDEYGGTVSDAKLREYVTRVGRSMTPFTESYSPDLPWEFTLLDSDVINAFALPGGKVFISRELMHQMTNEAQLAGVLGHEIGHVTAEHIDERIGQATMLGIGVAVADLLTRDKDGGSSRVIPMIVGVGGQGFLLKFSRDQESEADRLGMRYMKKAGYDPKGQLQVMVILEEASDSSGTSNILDAMFTTHPDPELRQQRIRELLRTNFANTQNNPNYQLHESRFNRVARPRLDAIYAKRPVSTAAFALNQLASWCAVCQLSGVE